MLGSQKILSRINCGCLSPSLSRNARSGVYPVFITGALRSLQIRSTQSCILSEENPAIRDEGATKNLSPAQFIISPKRAADTQLIYLQDGLECIEIVYSLLPDLVPEQPFHQLEDAAELDLAAGGELFTAAL